MIRDGNKMITTILMDKKNDLISSTETIHQM